MVKPTAVNLIGNRDAGQILGVSSSTVRTMAREGSIPVAAILPSGQRVFSREELERVASERALASATT